MKWKYDKKFKQWYPVYSNNNDFTIQKYPGEYLLTNGIFDTIGRFKKLKNAKLVAELIEEG